MVPCRSTILLMQWTGLSNVGEVARLQRRARSALEWVTRQHVTASRFNITYRYMDVVSRCIIHKQPRIRKLSGTDIFCRT